MHRLALILACSAVALVGGCNNGPESTEAEKSGASNVTFNRDIAPILFDNCASCHRPGEAAPFSLLTFQDARRRASQIAEVTQRRVMPPWPPEPHEEEFAGCRRLSDELVDAIRKWAKTGAPEGNPADLPKPPTFEDPWQLAPPDLVLESPAYSLPAAGPDQFRNFVIPVSITEPKWVASIEIRPTNPRATHHARLGVDRSGESARRDAADPLPGYEGMAWSQDPEGQLVIWVPGMAAQRNVPYSACRLYPKTCLVLHTHMQPTGKPETVQFRIGIRFAEEAPTIRPIVLRTGSRNIDIPAGESRYLATDEYVVPVDLSVRSILPHAHSLCRTVNVEAELPNGDQKSLIRINDFNEKWHDDYRFTKPVQLPRGTRIRSTFTYDNTDENIRNRHHPPVRVVYGSNVVDEMADVYMQVTADKPDERAALLEDIDQHETRSQIVGLQKTLEMYPQDPWSREVLASCYATLGSHKEAIRLLEERIRLDAEPVYAMVALGSAYLSSGDPVRAEQLVRDVLAKDPTYPLAWLGLGKSLDAQKKGKDAEQAYRKAIELAPALTEAHLSLADNLAKQGQLDAAQAACDDAIKLSPETPSSYLKLAGIQAQEHRYDDSLHNLEAAQRLAPYTHPSKVLLAVSYKQNGDDAKARQLLAEAHEESPDHPVPELFLGQIALREKRFDEARKYLTSAASRPIPTNWPASHKKRFLVLLNTERFKLAQQLNDETLARTAVDEWIKYDPENKQLQEIYNSLHSTGIK